MNYVYKLISNLEIDWDAWSWIKMITIITRSWSCHDPDHYKKLKINKSKRQPWQNKQVSYYLSETLLGVRSELSARMDHQVALQCEFTVDVSHGLLMRNRSGRCRLERNLENSNKFFFFFFFKCQSHMAFSYVLSFLLSTHSVGCTMPLLLSIHMLILPFFFSLPR